MASVNRDDYFRGALDLMAADGFHPGPRGYALWAESLAPFIARRWARVERD